MPTALAAPETNLLDHPDLAELSRRLSGVYSDLGGVALSGGEVILVDDLPETEKLRQEYADFIGPIVADISAEAPPDTPKANNPINSLDILHGAAAGRKECRSAIRADVATDVWEIFAQGGDGLEIEAEINQNGEVVQMSQTTNDRTVNSLRWNCGSSGGLRENTKVEGCNGYLIEGINRQGLPAGRKFLEISLVPDNAPAVELAEMNYSVDSVTLIFRTTEKISGNKMRMVSLLANGVDQDELPAYELNETKAAEVARQEKALEIRFDKAVVGELLESLGVAGAARMTTTELLGKMVLLPEGCDGMHVLAMYDRIASRHLGKPVFWGSTELGRQYAGRTPNRADYKRHWQECQDRHKQVNSIIDGVVDEAISRHNEAKTPLEAIRLEHDIAKKHTIKYSVKDTSVDARRTFGREAEPLIELARQSWLEGDHSGANDLVEKASEVAQTTGCPAAKRHNNKAAKSDEPKKTNAKGEKDQKSSKREWMRCVTCPLCNSQGVDAYIDYFEDRGKKRITCCSCSRCKWYDL